MTQRFATGFYAPLALVTLAVIAMAGCTSTIKGGTSSRTDEHTVQTPGEQRTEGRTASTRMTGVQEQMMQDALFQISPEGMVTVRFGKAAATTQPITETREETHAATSRPTATETTRTTTAATQPSASSPTGLPGMKFGDDGNVTSVWFEPDKVAENLKARALPITLLTLAAVAFFYFRRWLAGGVCVGCVVVVALVSPWLVDAAVVVGALAGVGFLVYEIVVKHKTLQQLKAEGKALLTPATPTQAEA